MLRDALGLAGGVGYRRLRNRRYPVRGAPAVLAAQSSHSSSPARRRQPPRTPRRRRQPPRLVFPSRLVRGETRCRGSSGSPPNGHGSSLSNNTPAAPVGICARQSAHGSAATRRVGIRELDSRSPAPVPPVPSDRDVLDRRVCERLLKRRRHRRAVLDQLLARVGQRRASTARAGHWHMQLLPVCNGTETPGAQPSRQEIAVAHGVGGTQ
jgi:hypothetical protein